MITSVLFPILHVLPVFSDNVPFTNSARPSTPSNCSVPPTVRLVHVSLPLMVSVLPLLTTTLPEDEGVEPTCQVPLEPQFPEETVRQVLVTTKTFPAETCVPVTLSPSVEFATLD